MRPPRPHCRQQSRQPSLQPHREQPLHEKHTQRADPLGPPGRWTHTVP